MFKGGNTMLLDNVPPKDLKSLDKFAADKVS